MFLATLFVLVVCSPAPASSDCRNDPVHDRADKDLKERQEILALSKAHQWKMTDVYNAFPPEKLKECGSCDFPQTAFEDQHGKRSLKNPGEVKEQTKMRRRPVDWKKIFYINLDSSTEQRDTLMGTLPAWAGGTPVERWSAISREEAKSSELTAHFAPKGLSRYVQRNADKFKWGTVARFLSHLSLLEHIYKKDPNGESLYVVLQDDAILTPDTGWKVEIERLLRTRKVPEGWDVLKIGYWGAIRCSDAVSEEVFEAKPPLYSGKDGKEAFYTGSVAYVIRPKSVPVILGQIREMELIDIDGAMVSSHNQGSAVAEDGLKHYWSRGTHTYVTRAPLVGGGMNRDKIRMLQLQEKMSTKIEDWNQIHSELPKSLKQLPGSDDGIEEMEAEEEEEMNPPWLDWPADHHAFDSQEKKQRKKEDLIASILNLKKANAMHREGRRLEENARFWKAERDRLMEVLLKQQEKMSPEEVKKTSTWTEYVEARRTSDEAGEQLTKFRLSSEL